jgi:predicted enzyme related to lactoylglutathione lyase
MISKLTKNELDEDVMKAQGIYLSWIIVKDLEKAIKFYTEVVGLELQEFHEEYRWAELKGPEGSILGIGEEDLNLGMKAGTNAVVTVSVENIESAKTHFKKLGATLVGDTIEIPGHVKMQTFTDVDGNTMQLVQQLH